jgi:hypothetical protein
MIKVTRRILAGSLLCSGWLLPGCNAPTATPPVAPALVPSPVPPGKTSAQPPGILDAVAALEKDDPAAALRIVTPLAESGQPGAQHLLGFMYDLGLGVPFDPATGLKWQQRAAASGDYWACLYLGWKYRLGFGADKPDPARAEPLEAEIYKRVAPARIVPVGWLQVSGLIFQPNFSRAARWLQSQAESGGVQAAATLAEYNLFGFGGPANAGQHLRWLSLAAERGDAGALRRLSLYYENGMGGLQQNQQLAQDYLRRAAQAGSAQAQYSLGRQYERGDGVPLDLAAAANWYRRASAQDQVAAINRLAGLLRKGIPPNAPDFTEALGLSKRAAALGNAEALADVAGMLRRGEGTAKDLAGALRHYQEAANLGYAFAAHMVGWMITYGEAGDRDYSEARRWFERAAKGGDEGAAREIGLLYSEGRGQTADQKEAFVWFERAAREGDAWAQNRVGWMLLKGTGIEQDQEEAVDWFKLAAKQGNGIALINLGNCYERGTGIAQDLSTAADRYREAIASGERSAIGNLGSVALASRGKARLELLREVTPLFAKGELPSGHWLQLIRGLVLLEASNPLRDAALGASVLEALDSKEPARVVALTKYYCQVGALIKARGLLEATPEPRDPVVNYYLGLFYVAGLGGQQDAVAGLALLRRGPKESALPLAYCQYLGIGMPKNDRAAFLLIQQAAELGEASARAALEKTTEAETLAYLFSLEPTTIRRIPVAVDGDRPDVRPQPTTTCAPVYPFLLGRLALTGSAKMEFIIDEEGLPTKVRVVESSAPDFGVAATAAINKWRFYPGKKLGRPVKTQVTQTLEFNLEDQSLPSSL